MKKALWCAVGMVLLLSTLVFAVDKPVSPLAIHLNKHIKIR